MCVQRRKVIWIHRVFQMEVVWTWLWCVPVQHITVSVMNIIIAMAHNAVCQFTLVSHSLYVIIIAMTHNAVCQFTLVSLSLYVSVMNIIIAMAHNAVCNLFSVACFMTNMTIFIIRLKESGVVTNNHVR